MGYVDPGDFIRLFDCGVTSPTVKNINNIVG
jgi:hypothetical protein